MAESLFKESGVEFLRSNAQALTKVINFTKVNLENTICQSINASVSVQVMPYYEIGSRNMHRVMGRTQGQGQLQNVMGPTTETLSALKTLCDICNPDDLNVTFYNACGSTSGGLRFKDCICTGITCDMNAAQDIINGSWTLMFSDVTEIQL